MSEWVEVPFSSLYEVPSKNGLMAPARVRGTGVLLVNMREIFAFDVISAQEMERAPLPERNPKAWLLRDGDLLFARQSLTRAGAGKVSLVHKPHEPMTFESHIIRVRLDERTSHSWFYYYFFRSLVGRRLMETIVEQVAAAGIRASDLGRLEVLRPPIAEQRRIAGVIRAFDDLIEANRALAANCVAAARAAYEHGVKDADCIALSKTVDLISGGTPKTTEASYWGGEIPWYSVVDSPGQDNPWVTATAKTITELGLRKSPARLLNVGDTIISARGTVGKLALVGAPMAMNQSCYALRGRHGGSGVFTYFSAQDAVAALRHRASGSVFDTIIKSTFDAVDVPFPGDERARRIEAVGDPLMWAAHALLEETTHLTHTRDELLGLLMSGRVRVEDVEGEAICRL